VEERDRADITRVKFDAIPIQCENLKVPEVGICTSRRFANVRRFTRVRTPKRSLGTVK
jgi:hypothetical protein